MKIFYTSFAIRFFNTSISIVNKTKRKRKGTFFLFFFLCAFWGSKQHALKRQYLHEIHPSRRKGKIQNVFDDLLPPSVFFSSVSVFCLCAISTLFVFSTIATACYNFREKFTLYFLIVLFHHTHLITCEKQVSPSSFPCRESTSNSAVFIVPPTRNSDPLEIL